MMIRRNISKVTQNHWHNGFLGTRHRTPRLNSAIALIYQNNNRLQGKKNGTSLSFLDLSQEVIPLGFARTRLARTQPLARPSAFEPLGSHPSLNEKRGCLILNEAVFFSYILCNGQ